MLSRALNSRERGAGTSRGEKKTLFSQRKVHYWKSKKFFSWGRAIGEER